MSAFYLLLTSTLKREKKRISCIEHMLYWYSIDTDLILLIHPIVPKCYPSDSVPTLASWPEYKILYEVFLSLYKFSVQHLHWNKISNYTANYFICLWHTDIIWLLAYNIASNLNTKSYPSLTFFYYTVASFIFTFTFDPICSGLHFSIMTFNSMTIPIWQFI